MGTRPNRAPIALPNGRSNTPLPTCPPQNHLDAGLWRWGSWLVRLDELVWGLAEGSGAQPLPKWPTEGEYENVTCGYVGHP